jgi:hypothetical protein
MNSEMWLRHCSSPGDRNLYDFGSSGPSIAEHAIKPVFLMSRDFDNVPLRRH